MLLMNNFLPLGLRIKWEEALDVDKNAGFQI